MTCYAQQFYTIRVEPKKAGIVTKQMIDEIARAIEQVAEHGFGEVHIHIEKGVPRWVSPAPSYPLAPGASPNGQHKK